MPEKIGSCLNRGRMESLGNDDVSIVCKMENPEGTTKVRYSFVLCVISDILLSSCFESYGPKDSC